MTNDALKAAALEAAKKLWDSARHIGMARDIIVVFLQPLIDADRQETERLEAALRGIQKDKCTASGLRSRARKALNGRIPHNVACMEHKIERLEKALRGIATENKAGLAQGIACTALGKEK